MGLWRGEVEGDGWVVGVGVVVGAAVGVWVGFAVGVAVCEGDARWRA